MCQTLQDTHQHTTGTMSNNTTDAVHENWKTFHNSTGVNICAQQFNKWRVCCKALMTQQENVEKCCRIFLVTSVASTSIKPIKMVLPHNVMIYRLCNMHNSSTSMFYPLSDMETQGALLTASSCFFFWIRSSSIRLTFAKSKFSWSGFKASWNICHLDPFWISEVLF